MWPMAKAKQRKITTPPKGKPTARRDQPPSAKARRRAQIQWAIVIAAIVAIMVVAFFAGPGDPINPLG